MLSAFRKPILASLVLNLALIGAQAQEGPLLDPETQPLDLRPKTATQNQKPKPAPAPTPKKPPAPATQKPKEAPRTEVARNPAEIPTGTVRPVVQSERGPAVVSEVATVAVPDVPKTPFDEAVITRYCSTLSTAASDGRLAWQAVRLQEMEARLRERIIELETRRNEVADWMKRREEALRKADDTVVAIYSKMKPEAAAAQFSAMDESGAAAILSKLPPRQASTMLNEIDPPRAARIAAEMAGVGRRDVVRSGP